MSILFGRGKHNDRFIESGHARQNPRQTWLGQSRYRVAAMTSWGRLAASGPTLPQATWPSDATRSEDDGPFADRRYAGDVNLPMRRMPLFSSSTRGTDSHTTNGPTS